MHLKTYGSGIFFSARIDKDLPAEVTIEGKVYFRFMNFIYLPCEPEDLSEEQVVAVNEIRREFFDVLADRDKNLHVKQLMVRLIENVRPRALLELGGGYNPLFAFPPIGFDYWVADLNENAIALALDRGLKGFLFRSTDILPLVDSSVDLIVAIFVLQFNLSPDQIFELGRVLRPHGVIVANVYRRSRESKAKLLQAFASANFRAIIRADPTRLCRGHEYWCLFKDGSSEVLAKVLGFFEEEFR